MKNKKEKDGLVKALIGTILFCYISFNIYNFIFGGFAMVTIKTRSGSAYKTLRTLFDNDFEEVMVPDEPEDEGTEEFSVRCKGYGEKAGKRKVQFKELC